MNRRVITIALASAIGACGNAGSNATPQGLPPHCASVVNTFDACFVGDAFAECPGAADPRAYCSATSQHGEAGCVWVSNGCPLEYKVVPLQQNCECTHAECSTTEVRGSLGNFVRGWGRSPWDRTRESNLTVKVEPLGDVATMVQCSPCTDPCSTPATPCGAEKLAVHRETPGTVVVRLLSSVGGGQWYLAIEIVPEGTAFRARACRREFTDAPLSCEARGPDCATTGELTVDREPTVTNAALLQGKLNAAFANGFVINASFGEQ